MYDIESVIKELKRKTAKPCISLKTALVDTTQFDSKVGGVPYMPNNFEYPRSTTNGEPLRLLAQINFEQMPHLEDFPTKGILQFYIQDDEDLSDMYGLDFDHPTTQDSFRIIYHENVDYTANNIHKLPKFKQSAIDNYIVEHECKLIPTLAEQSILLCDVNFEDEIQRVFKSIYPKATDEDFKTFYEEEEETIWDEYDSQDYNRVQHAIGGHPYFTQEDPRYVKPYQDYTVLLLQIDTDDTSGIMWGDAGVGNFFIKPEDLRNLNFSDVLYNWDCF
jgi:uncharacterized protein YwqG